MSNRIRNPELDADFSQLEFALQVEPGSLTRGTTNCLYRTVRTAAGYLYDIVLLPPDDTDIDMSALLRHIDADGPLDLTVVLDGVDDGGAFFEIVGDPFADTCASSNVAKAARVPLTPFSRVPTAKPFKNQPTPAARPIYRPRSW